MELVQRQACLCTSAAQREIYSSVLCRNFALVTEQQVDLSPGLNVITGESGSGKSVLLAALGQALGCPADDFIRPPSDTATVQAAFILSAAGIVSILQMMPFCMKWARCCPKHACQAFLGLNQFNMMGWPRGSCQAACLMPRCICALFSSLTRISHISYQLASICDASSE